MDRPYETRIMMFALLQRILNPFVVIYRKTYVVYLQKYLHGADISTKRFLLKNFDLNKADILLDMGGGTGFWAKIMAPHVEKVVIIDILEKKGGYEESFKIARDKIKDENIDYIIGDIEHLPVKSSSVDKILCHQVLEHLRDAGKIFTETDFVLKNGGIFIVSTPNSDYLNSYTFPISSFLSAVLPSKVKSRLPDLLCGIFVREGYEGWKKAVGHVKDGYSLNELRDLGVQTDMEIDRYVYQHKKIGIVFWELWMSIPLLYDLIRPISDIWYILEEKIDSEGNNFIIKYKKL